MNNLYRHVISLVRHDSLLRNSLYLLVSNFVLAGFGFLFWIVAAHVFTSEQVGLGSALIAVVSLLSSIGQFGFNTALIRYLPKAERRNELISTVIWLTIILSALVSLGYLLGMPLFSDKLLFVRNSPWLAATFVLATVLASVNALTDSIFISFRSTQYIMIINFIASISKVVLPILLVATGSLGVFLAYVIMTIIGVTLSLGIILRRLAVRWQLVMSPVIVRQIARFSLANHAATFMSQLPGLVLPVLILQQLGARNSAYYYLAMMIVTFLNTVPQMINQSLFAEGSHGELALGALAMRSLRISLMIMIPAVALVLVLGRFALGVFGSEYADGGIGFLSFEALASLILCFNLIGNTILRVEHRVNAMVAVNALYVVASLTLVWIMVPYGLTAVGIALLIGQAVAAVGYGAVTLPGLLARRWKTASSV